MRSRRGSRPAWTGPKHLEHANQPAKHVSDDVQSVAPIPKVVDFTSTRTMQTTRAAEMSAKLTTFFVLLVSIGNWSIAQDRDGRVLDCDTLYNDGVDAFLARRWGSCVAHFEAALASDKKMNSDTMVCQRRCHEDAAAPAVQREDVESLHLSEKLVKKSFCLQRCKREEMYAFDKAKAYEYLQHCYFQQNQPEQAASAAFTLLVANPEHEAMRTMLELYATLPGFDMSRVVDMEEPPYVALFSQGVAAYKREEYARAAVLLEESLRECTGVEELCRVDCVVEAPMAMEWISDRGVLLVDQVANELVCKSHCPVALTAASNKGETQESMIPIYFKYLHLAYFKDGNVRKACEAAASYLLFYPSDESMKTTLAHYESLPQALPEYSVAREETARYVWRSKYEAQLLQFIEEHSGKTSDEESQAGEESSHSVHRRDVRDNMIPNFDVDKTEALEETREKKQSDKIKSIREGFIKNTKLLMTDVELKGPNRVLAEGLLSTEECQTMLDMAKDASDFGDASGRGRHTPWSNREDVKTITMRRAALLAHFGILEHSVVDKFFEIAERAKVYLERHFNLEGKLYHEYSNLFCRTVLPSDETVLPYSQVIHADNCRPEWDGTCPRCNVTGWRDFTTIMYLNGDIEGGELFFTGNMTESGIQSEVKPACGRMAGFSSGGENLHAVRALRSGRRCTIIQLFTYTPEQHDRKRVLAQTVRDRSRLGGDIDDEAVLSLDDFREFSH